jgi:hypothetical protein
MAEVSELDRSLDAGTCGCDARESDIKLAKMAEAYRTILEVRYLDTVAVGCMTFSELLVPLSAAVFVAPLSCSASVRTPTARDCRTHPCEQPKP